MRGVDAAGQGRQKWIPTRLAHAWSLDLVLLHRIALQKPTARSPWVGFAASEKSTQAGKVLETLGRSGQRQVSFWVPPSLEKRGLDVRERSW